MAEYLKRALGELASRDPDWSARGGLVKALAARRSAGNVINELTAGQAGGPLMDTADPLGYVTSEIAKDQNRVLQRAALERQAGRDVAEDQYRAATSLARMMAANNKSGGLTVNQINKDYKDLLTEAGTLRDIFSKAAAVDGLVSTGNMEGVGYGVGAEGFGGDLLRGFTDMTGITSDAQGNKAKLVDFINTVLTEEAGKAQTLTETRRRLAALGLTGSVSEDVLREKWPQVMTGLRADLANLKRKYALSGVTEMGEAAAEIAELQDIIGEGGGWTITLLDE